MYNRDEDKYQKAKKRVEEIKGFYSNLITYLIVIPLLGYLNYRTTDFPWAIFPAVGWGLGLLFHGICAFGFNPFLGRDWEERKMKELMNSDEF
ncbi:2TM domain-containing protein [uncultured Croceitalea sp.]|uniref:2TM domain-containing protein n=1 Tax=uncultured Croceitalea sp. TaxID=1798908 RepID=UPI00374EF31A